MKIFITSDWHLDAYTAGLERFDDIERAAAGIVQDAIGERADLFLFLGDLCDPHANRTPRCIAATIRLARLLAAHDIPSRWLVGNHDVIEDGSRTSTLTPLGAAATVLSGDRDSWRVLDEPCAELIAGVWYVWLPYVSRAAGYDAAAFVEEQIRPDDARAVVVAGHLSVPGIDPGSETHEMGRGRAMWLPVDSIRARWPESLVLNGHYHRQRTDGPVRIPGSIARLTFGEETHAPGYLVAEIELRRRRPEWRVTGCSVPARGLMTVRDSDDASAVPPGALVRVCPPAGATPEQVADLVATAGDRAEAVKVVAAPTTPAVVVLDGESPGKGRLGPRAVVEAMVAESAAVDRDALREFVAEILEQEGL